MTPEELMKPRYKVIRTYPRMNLDKVSVGDIISPYGMGFLYPDKIKKKCDYHPHLFKQLQWWEERKENELPKYVKSESTGSIKKVDYFDLVTTSMWFMYLEGESAPYCPGGSALIGTAWLPASEEDYIQHIKSIK